MTTEEMYDYLMDNLEVSQETMSVACSLRGYSEDTMKRVLYAITGYWDFDQYKEEINEED